MKASRLLLFILIILVLASCSEPATPDLRLTSIQEINTESKVYLPNILVSRTSAKKSVAGYANRELAEKLCLPEPYLWHNWAPYISRTSAAQQIPFYWDDQSIPIAARTIPFGYNDVIFIANEPELTGQANMSPVQVAATVYAAKRLCPGCKVIGPHMSQIAPDGYFRAFWESYLALGGSASDFSAVATHIYAGDEMEAEWMLDRFQESLPLEFWRHPIWVTEANGNDGSYETALEVFEILDKDVRVEKWFAFIPDPSWGHLALVDGEGNLTETGEAFRDAGCYTWR